MNIGIDISQIVYKGSGVGTYTENLVHALLSHKNAHSYTFFFSSLRRKLDPKIKNLINTNGHKLKSYPFPPIVLDLLWNRLHILPIEALIGNIDVFIASDWTQPPSKKAKQVSIVHDLVVYKYPETSTTNSTFALQDMRLSPNIVQTHKRRLHWVKKECDKIIADSESTKKDIVELLTIDSNNIDVVYPYIHTTKPKQKNIDQTLKSFKLDRPFILTVGKLEPRKNIKRLIEAFSILSLDIDLVIVGEDGWGDTQHEETMKPDSIKFLGYVTDSELHSLYSAAEFMIYPSLYEGFGYPVVEAMALGCPVATSNSSSTGEIAKDAGLLFNPTSVQDISNSIKRLHSDSSLRDKLRKKGLKHSQEFTLDNYIDNLIQSLERLK